MYSTNPEANLPRTVIANKLQVYLRQKVDKVLRKILAVMRQLVLSYSNMDRTKGHLDFGDNGAGCIYIEAAE
jgi:hypothetical protein